MARVGFVRPTPIFVSFDVGIYTGLDSFGMRFLETGTAYGTQTIPLAQVVYNAPTVTIPRASVTTAALTSGHTYDVEVRAVYTDDGLTVYGPWSDTAYDYTA